jgi:hypothetical protein
MADFGSPIFEKLPKLFDNFFHLFNGFAPNFTTIKYYSDKNPK